MFPEIGEDWKALHQKCLKGSVEKDDSVVFKRADGSIECLSWEVRPWYISREEIGGILMLFNDISKRKLWNWKELE